LSPDKILNIKNNLIDANKNIKETENCEEKKLTTKSEEEANIYLKKSKQDLKDENDNFDHVNFKYGMKKKTKFYDKDKDKYMKNPDRINHVYLFENSSMFKSDSVNRTDNSQNINSNNFFVKEIDNKIPISKNSSKKTQLIVYRSSNSNKKRKLSENKSNINTNNDKLENIDSDNKNELENSLNLITNSFLYQTINFSVRFFLNKNFI
jgi:hypothetical protein